MSHGDQATMRPPDEHHDVIVRQCWTRGTEEAYQDTWTVSIGDEQQGVRDSLKSATELASHLGTLHSRPAWLLDESGYPLKPLQPW